jgi:hypothetical protein
VVEVVDLRCWKVEVNDISWDEILSRVELWISGKRLKYRKTKGMRDLIFVPQLLDQTFSD